MGKRWKKLQKEDKQMSKQITHTKLKEGNKMAAETLQLKTNRPFPSCCQPHYESKAKCKVFVMKISFHS